MKKRQWLVPVFLLCAGLIAGFAAGKSAGFATGSEWALMQADIHAREAGVFMPVSYDGRTFRVVIKQPRGLYRKASRLADQQEAGGSLYETVTVSQVSLDRIALMKD